MITISTSDITNIEVSSNDPSLIITVSEPINEPITIGVDDASKEDKSNKVDVFTEDPDKYYNSVYINNLPSGGGSETPDATTSIKGKLKLAGDISGTADFPTVPALINKVDKVTGKGLSTNDYSNTDKSKVDLFDQPVSSAEKTTWNSKEDSSNKSNSTTDYLSTSKFPVWSIIVSFFDTTKIKTILGQASSTIDGWLSSTDWNTFNNKQNNLVSGTNIKTIGGVSVLGSGDIPIGAYQRAGVYMLAHVASDISGYDTLPLLDNFTAGSTYTTAGISINTTGVLMKSLSTTALGITAIPPGVVTLKYITTKTSGTIYYQTYFEMYKRTSGGTETLLVTSNLSSQTNLNTDIHQEVNAIIPDPISILSTDRIVIKIYCKSLTGSPTVSLSYDGTTNAIALTTTAQTTYISENIANKQNSLSIDGTGLKYPTIDAVNAGFASKSMSAFSFRVNNTSATADATEVTYKDINSASYSETPVFTGTTPPSTAISAYYTYYILNKRLFLTIVLGYNSPGASLTQIVLPLPSGIAQPNTLGSLGSNASEIMLAGVGMTAASDTGVANAFRNCILRRNSANTGFEIVITQASGSIKNIFCSINYLTV